MLIGDLIARALAAKSLELAPQLSVGLVTKTWLFKCEDNLQLDLDAMRKSGYPD